MKSASGPSDRALFTALLGGSERALEILFRRHYAALCRLSHRMLQDSATAEDVVQDFFVFLWEKRGTLPKEVDSVNGYLRRAVRNRSLNFLRDRGRIPVDGGDLPENVAAPLPANTLEQEVQKKALHQAIDRLPERCRLVFVLCKVEGMTQREVSEELGISIKTIENQMSRAYRFLRQWLSSLLICYLCL